MKKPAKPILEQLYYGEFFPEEQLRSYDPDYLPTCRKLSKSMETFSFKLNDEEKKNLDEIVNLIAIRDSMDCYASFAYGFRSGAMLMHEILTGKGIPSCPT